MSINRVMLLGRLGSDPELKYTQSGHAVCSLSVATSEKYKDKSGEHKEKTEWHSVKVWGKLAELCNQYLSKGREVFVEGSLETRSWDDKNSGQKRYKTEINAKVVQFIGGQGVEDQNESKGQNNANNQQEYKPQFNQEYSNEDIPFWGPRFLLKDHLKQDNGTIKTVVRKDYKGQKSANNQQEYKPQSNQEYSSDDIPF